MTVEKSSQSASKLRNYIKSLRSQDSLKLLAEDRFDYLIGFLRQLTNPSLALILKYVSNITDNVYKY